jgi:hypothetical protein
MSRTSHAERPLKSCASTVRVGRLRRPSRTAPPCSTPCAGSGWRAWSRSAYRVATARTSAAGSRRRTRTTGVATPSARRCSARGSVGRELTCSALRAERDQVAAAVGVVAPAFRDGCELVHLALALRAPNGHVVHGWNLARSCICRLALGEGRRDLGEVLESRRAFSEVPLQPAQRRPLVLRRPALRVQVHELQRVLERRVLQPSAMIASRCKR